MKRININSGLGDDYTIQEAIEEVGFETLVNFMDEETCEAVHNKFAPCTEEQFVEEYLKRAPYDLIIG